MINKLSQEQESLIPIVRDEWINFCIGGNDDIDVSSAQEGIFWIYEMAKLKKPMVIFVDSPMACQLAIPLLENITKRKGDQVWTQVRDQVWDQVRTQVWTQVRDQVWDQVRDQVWDQVRTQVRTQVRNQVLDQVLDQVRTQVLDQVGTQMLDQVLAQVWDQVRTQVRDQVWDQVWTQVGTQVWDQVGTQVRDQVRDQVLAQVGTQVWTQVRNQVWTQVWDQVGTQVRDQVRVMKLEFFGYAYRDLGNDSGWIAWVDFFERIGIKFKDDRGNKYKKYLRSGIFMSVFLDGLAIVCRRPNIVKRNGRNMLHCDIGPALTWRDGYQMYSWNGTRVTEQIIMRPETLTKEQIITEKNSEVSRAIAERLGWDKYLKIIGAVLIDKWFDERTSCHYELYDFKERKGSLQPRLLKMESPECNDGTRPYYIEPVPPEMKTCKAARRWQCDPTGEEYKDKPAKWVAECNENAELVFEVEA